MLLALSLALLAAAPNDPLFLGNGEHDQWNLMGSVHPDFPDAGVRGIDAEGAWDLTRGRPDVLIAVLDSGVLVTHPDLAANIALNAGEAMALDTSGDGVLLLSEAATIVPDIDQDGAITPLDVLAFAENGIDDDGNGYVDDVIGWDFEDDDNDPTDTFGHGTGRAGIAAAVTDNGIGMAGVCPECRILPVRFGRTFVAVPERLAEAIAYAADRGAASTVMATGSLGNSSSLREAVTYATERGTVLCAAIGNERSRHHHFPQSYEDVIATAGVKPGDFAAPDAWNARWSGTNFGAHASVAAPTYVWATRLEGDWDFQGGTSSSVPHCGAVAALVRSRALDLGVTLGARQIRQIMQTTAEGYPEWTPFAGYGRLDARAAVAAVGADVPPEARIVSPEWYSTTGEGETVTPSISAATGVTVSLEWGAGVDPQVWTPFTTSFVATAEGMDPLLDVVGDAYAVTIRMTATDGAGNTSVDRRTFFVHADSGLDLGSSIEGAPVLADLDGDNRLETIVAASDGVVHVFGSVSWTAELDPVSFAHAGAPARTELDAPRPMVFGAPAVGDLDGDALPEIVVAALDGKVYLFDRFGARVRTISAGAAVWGAPVLADLDADGALEIVVASYDRRVHAFRGDGTELWSALAEDLSAAKAFPGLVATPAVGDVTGDGIPEVIVATTEAASDSGFLSRGRVYAFSSTGVGLAGFPVAPFGLMAETFPVVGSGVPGAPVLADLDGDGAAEILASHVAGQIAAFHGDGSLYAAFDHGEFVSALSELGPNPDDADPRWEFNAVLLAQLAVADLGNDGRPEVMSGTMGLEEVDINTLAANPGEALTILQTLFTVWSADGRVRGPEWPRPIEGWTLFASATIADLDGDTLPEVIAGTDAGWLHAWNARGEEPEGFPKFMGGWIGPVAAVGDRDANGKLDLVAATREGRLFTWTTEGPACLNGELASSWPAFHHDVRNTGDVTADAIPPGAIADARIEDGRVTFTAVGDDGFAGRAARYEARVSSSPITTLAEWNAATPVEVGGTKLAGVEMRAGSGLSGYAAVRAWDERENASPLPAAGAATVPADPCAKASVIRLDDPARGCACDVATGSRPSPLLALGALLLLLRRRVRCA